MAKIYFVRHQAAGILTSYPFASEPSKEQLAAIERLCFQGYGAEHPKSKEPYWLRVIEAEVLGPSDIPSVPDLVEVTLRVARDPVSIANEASLSKLGVSAVGTVTPPKK